MEGFECKLVSAWPFDPLSAQELLLLQKPPLLNPSSQQHNKLLAFSTLNLNSSSLSPFDLNLNLSTEADLTVSSVIGVEDINNNSDLVGVSFLTLDPIGTEEDVAGLSLPDSHSNRVHILRSCFATRDENEGDDQLPSNNDTMTNKSSSSIIVMPKEEQLDEGRALPKFAEIHFDHVHQQQEDGTRNGDIHSQQGGGDVENSNVEVDVDDVDGIYFNIQDLDQYDRDGKGYLIDDLMGDCNPPEVVGGPDHSTNPGDFIEPQPTLTLDVGLLVDDDDDEDHGQTSTSNSNSFDLDLDLDDKDEIDYQMDMDIANLHHLREGELLDGEKQELKCKFCGFVCCSKSSLGIHERRHTGERPYACKYCGRLFNSAQCCKHHERLHTGDKPFECQYCGKKYAVSTRLKRHERVHTREEPYKCGEPGCGKTFRWFDAFRDHRNTHNGVPLYLCSVCGKSFTSYLKFYYHERGHFLKRERDRDRDRAKKLQQELENANPGLKQKPHVTPTSAKKKVAKKKVSPKAKIANLAISVAAKLKG